MSEYSLEVIRDLVNRKLPWYVLKEMMSAPKDKDRFDKYIKVLQEKVPWKERILLPIHEHLYIVEKNGEAIVKAKCGYEFGDYRENWLLKTLIYVRDTPEKFRE
ncbi:MAG: acetone carboxylase subunit gamma, partial [Candidatus Jordarchaeaceae archaeon]